LCRYKLPPLGPTDASILLKISIKYTVTSVVVAPLPPITLTGTSGELTVDVPISNAQWPLVIGKSVLYLTYVVAFMLLQCVKLCVL
jgi:hypothetical protein